MTDETRLSDELARRAESVQGTHLDLASVRGRARQIRRRQWAGGVAAVAAVALIAVPTALLAGGGVDRSDGPQPATPSPTRAVDPFVKGVPTLQSGVIIFQDGPRVPLQLGQGQRADAFAVLGTDRYVVTVSNDQGEREVVLFDGAGGQLSSHPSESGLVATPGAGAVAWVGADGAPRLLVAGSDEPQVLGKVAGDLPIPSAITGTCTPDCTVHVRIGGGEEPGPSWAVSTDGTVRPEPSGVPAVIDVSADGSLIGGLDSYSDDGVHACGGVFAVDQGSFLWHGCDDNVFDFSPDGALVATTFGEGLGPTALTIRDSRTGTTGAGISGGWISSFAWEDDTHLLAVRVMEDGTTTVERIGPEGESTLLDGFHTSPDDVPAVILPVVG